MSRSKPKLSILIPTVGSRNERFLVLLRTLHAQAAKYPNSVEIVAYWNNGELTLGEIRQALAMNARGEYISYVDDDDKVPDYYCDEILPLLDGVDYIGFQMQLFHRGEPERPTYHSLRYSNWFEDEKGYYRDLSHLNPLRRQLLLENPYTSEMPEDTKWADRARGKVKTEHYINKIMYEYWHDPDDSIWQGISDAGIYERPKVKYKYFRWHPASKVSNG